MKLIFFLLEMVIEVSEPFQNFIYMDEAGSDLTKCRTHRQNIFGYRATVDVLGQVGGTLTMGAAIS